MDLRGPAVPLPRPPPHPNPPPRGGREPDSGLRRIASLLVLLAVIPYPIHAVLTHRAEAQRRSHADFDAACAWIAREARRAGPILTRHPGEVFWQTGRLTVLPASDEPDALIHQIQDQKIGYILVDTDRFANAAPTPLARLVAERPDLVRRVFEGPVAVDEVVANPLSVVPAWGRREPADLRPGARG